MINDEHDLTKTWGKLLNNCNTSCKLLKSTKYCWIKNTKPLLFFIFDINCFIISRISIFFRLDLSNNRNFGKSLEIYCVLCKTSSHQHAWPLNMSTCAKWEFKGLEWFDFSRFAMSGSGMAALNEKRKIRKIS